MTDLMDIDERLAAQAKPFVRSDYRMFLSDGRRRAAGTDSCVPVTIAAAVALVVAGVAIGLNIRHDAAPASPAKPAPTVPAVPDPNFAVAAPPDFHHGGAASLVAPACRISALRATATTRATADGVVGVVSIVGGNLCSISPNVTALRLLDANGKPLHVPTSSGNTVNQPPTESSYSFGVSTGRMPSAGKHAPDLSSTAARIGFAWSGTYCGPAAASVEISIEGHQIKATISGPGPTCKRQASSVLIPGTLGAAGQGVVPAPMSWRTLHARLVLPSTFTPGPIPVVVVLTNTGSQTVVLSNPCATYVARGSLDSSSGSSGFGLPNANLCDLPRMLGPGKSVTLTLPSMDFPSTKIFPQLRVQRGDLLTVTWSIAGVPTATATTRIR